MISDQTREKLRECCLAICTHPRERCAERQVTLPRAACIREARPSLFAVCLNEEGAVSKRWQPGHKYQLCREASSPNVHTVSGSHILAAKPAHLVGADPKDSPASAKVIGQVAFTLDMSLWRLRVLGAAGTNWAATSSPSGPVQPWEAVQYQSLETNRSGRCPAAP